MICVRDSKNNSLVSGLILPDQHEFDIQYRVGLTRKQTNQVKNSCLKFVPHTSTFDYLPRTTQKVISMQPYYLSFRVVRFKLTQDTYEVLLTNLPEDEFSVSELKELYAMRWGISISFRD